MKFTRFTNVSTPRTAPPLSSIFIVAADGSLGFTVSTVVLECFSCLPQKLPQVLRLLDRPTSRSRPRTQSARSETVPDLPSHPRAIVLGKRLKHETQAMAQAGLLIALLLFSQLVRLV